MTPFTDIGRHNDLRFEAVREHGAGLLRGQTPIQKVEIGGFSTAASLFPLVVGEGILVQVARLNNRDLAAELILAVMLS